MKKEDPDVPAVPDLVRFDQFAQFQQFKRIAFRAESTSLVKRLRGFIKGHTIPGRPTPSANKFVARIAVDEIQADIERVYQALREAYRFRRNQLEASSADGMGAIHTPLFDYTVGVAVDPVRAGTALWRREITSLDDPLAVRRPEFKAVFGTQFQSLVFGFESEIAVAKLIDHFEAENRPGVSVLCGSDASWCDIILKGFRGAIHINAKCLTISGRHEPSAASLLDQFLVFIEHLPRKPEWPGLR
jgi:hypothetical protein